MGACGWGTATRVASLGGHLPRASSRRVALYTDAAATEAGADMGQTRQRIGSPVGSGVGASNLPPISRLIPLFSLLPLLLLLSLSSPAHAAPQVSDIVDRNYDIDTHQAGVIGSSRLVGMGGAGTVLSEGADGLISNPGATALRAFGSTDWWDWDGAVNGFVPDLGSDLDNNGLPTRPDHAASVGNVALMTYFGSFAFGLRVGTISYAVPLPDGSRNVTFETNAGSLTVARAFADGALAIGAGLRFRDFTMLDTVRREQFFSAIGTGVEAGAVWAPREQSYRLGLSGAHGIVSSEIETTCDPNDCFGRVLPTRAVSPWQVALGASRRWAPTPWNRTHDRWRDGSLPFRDERSILLAAELHVVGRLDRATGLEAFTVRQLQASGEEVTISPRVGAEAEVFPGRLRLRAGSYWEPGRFRGVSGRPHATGGLELRLFAFTLWKVERRISASVAVDLARRYGNVGYSFGFWH